MHVFVCVVTLTVTAMTLRLLLAGALLGTVVVAAPAQAAVPDRWGFGYMQNPTPPAGMLLDPTRQWKSDNIPDALVFVSGLGRYRVVFPNMASAPGVAHATAVAPDARFCQVFYTFNSGADKVIEVQCFKHNPVQTPDWSRFTVMFSSSSGAAAGGGAYAYVRGNLTGGFATSYNSSGGANGVSWGGAGSGTYKVWLQGVSTGLFDGNLQVTAEHPNSARRCKVDKWFPGPGGHDVVVRCYDQAGAPADSWFNLTYHRERAVYGAVAPPKRFAYMWTPGYPGGPSNYNSVGSFNSLTPSGPGLSYIEFHKVGYRETHVQVGAFANGASYCNLQNVWGISGAVVLVRNVICFDAFGAPSAERFFITYSSRV